MLEGHTVPVEPLGSTDPVSSSPPKSMVKAVATSTGGPPAAETGATGVLPAAGGVTGALLAPRLRHTLPRYGALLTLTRAATVLVPLLAVVPPGCASGLVPTAVALLAPTALSLVTTYQMLVMPDGCW
ncbi:hypothetical protein [Streptomyces sp. x-80]|uniref:hypothetical protein n=1 Tax=Streptomyces sp. x-80 TaxID=2789282 RepID=UPI0039818CC8